MYNYEEIVSISINLYETSVLQLTDNAVINFPNL